MVLVKSQNSIRLSYDGFHRGKETPVGAQCSGLRYRFAITRRSSLIVTLSCLSRSLVSLLREISNIACIVFNQWSERHQVDSILRIERSSRDRITGRNQQLPRSTYSRLAPAPQTVTRSRSSHKSLRTQSRPSRPGHSNHNAPTN